jgi:hypothetical protein
VGGRQSQNQRQSQIQTDKLTERQFANRRDDQPKEGVWCVGEVPGDRRPFPLWFERHPCIVEGDREGSALDSVLYSIST